MPMSELRVEGVSTATRTQHCTLCKNHGIKAKKKGHECPFRECDCQLCTLGRYSRKIMCHQQRLWRHKKQKLKKNEEDLEDGEKVQYCDRCRNHNKLEKKRGHTCPFVSCQCKFCSLTFKRQIQMMYQQRVRRSHVVSKVEDPADPPPHNTPHNEEEAPPSLNECPESPCEELPRHQASDMGPDSGSSDSFPVRPCSPTPVSYEQSPEGSCDSTSSRVAAQYIHYRSRSLANSYIAHDDYEPVHPLTNPQQSARAFMPPDDDETCHAMLPRDIKVERLSPDLRRSEYEGRSAFSTIRSFDRQMTGDAPAVPFRPSDVIGDFCLRGSDANMAHLRSQRLPSHAMNLGLGPGPLGALQRPMNYQQRWLLPPANTYYLGMPHNAYPWMEMQDRW